MSKSVSTNLKNHLASDSVTVCSCVRIIRKDGFKIGFTTCDIQFDYTFITNPDGGIGPVTYYPVGSIDPTAIKSSEGTGVNSLDIQGAITSDKVTDEDLVKGLYDGAEMTFFKVNYNSLADGEIIDLKGHVGELTVEDIVYHLEVLSQTSYLKKMVVDVTAPTCRVRKFGDAQCKLNLASLTFNRTVDSVISRYRVVFASDAHANGYYNYGTAEATSGDNDGVVREIKTHVLSSGKADCILKEPFPFTIAPGDTFTLIAGCDRTFTACKGFGNANNFRGEPHLPGNDQLVQVGRPPK